MVLAASPKQAMVWGFCDPGAKVDVALGGKKIAATVGPDQADGKLTTWRALLPATAASFTTHNITATSAGNTITLADVMFGEVWVCSGQVRRPHVFRFIEMCFFGGQDFNDNTIHA
jgi:sialate O-acetylesterase